MSTVEEKESYWFKHYNSFNKSGLTQKEYCRQQEISYWTFNAWKRRFDKSEQDTVMQEIPLKILTDPVSCSPIEIVFENNIRISVPENFSPETLKRIMFALREEV